jgi:hypothetical protein
MFYKKCPRITFYTYLPVNPYHFLTNHHNRCTLVPLSAVTVHDQGMTKRATQLTMNVYVHVLASLLRRGTDSIHTCMVDLSMADKMYTWPSEEAGRGPTR